MRAGLICAVSLLCLFGCAPAYLEQRTDEAQNAADVVRGADLRPRFPHAPREQRRRRAVGRLHVVWFFDGDSVRADRRRAGTPRSPIRPQGRRRAATATR